jgi:hypothetical protein
MLNLVVRKVTARLWKVKHRIPSVNTILNHLMRPSPLSQHISQDPRFNIQYTTIFFPGFQNTFLQEHSLSKQRELPVLPIAAVCSQPSAVLQIPTPQHVGVMSRY